MIMIHDKMALRDSARHIDSNGYMHVDVSNLTKEQVVPYRGDTIPGFGELGLDPNQVYMIYRPGPEIEKAAPTFNGLPLMMDHWDMDADHIPKDQVMGSLGTDARYEAPYLKNSLIITDSQAIKAVEDGSFSELSASYACDIDMTGGIFDGVAYDGSMHNIMGNHVALVPEGRAGHDVRVADSALEGGETKMGWVEKLKEAILELMTDKEALKEIMAADETKIAPGMTEGTEMNENPAVTKPEQTTDVEPVDEVADEIRQLMQAAGLDPEDKAAQKAFLAGMAAGKPVEDACKDGDPAAAAAPAPAETAQDKAMVHDKAFYADLYQASLDVAPFVGRIQNPFAFDSAADIYKKALDAKGVATDGIDPSAFKFMVSTLARPVEMPHTDEEDPINKKLMGIRSI